MTTDRELLEAAARAPRSWRDQYECAWTESPQEIKARELATKYHELCESFDRTVCTGPILRDGIMPATDREHVLINRNARNVMREIMVEAEQHAITASDIRRAIVRAAAGIGAI